MAKPEGVGVTMREWVPDVAPVEKERKKEGRKSELPCASESEWLSEKESELPCASGYRMSHLWKKKERKKEGRKSELPGVSRSG